MDGLVLRLLKLKTPPSGIIISVLDAIVIMLEKHPEIWERTYYTLKSIGLELVSTRLLLDMVIMISLSVVPIVAIVSSWNWLNSAANFLRQPNPHITCHIQFLQTMPNALVRSLEVCVEVVIIIIELLVHDRIHYLPTVWDILARHRP